MNIIVRTDSDGCALRPAITRRLTMRSLKRSRRIACVLATGALLLLLCTGLAAASPAARPQEPRAFPDVTGTYEGPEVRTFVCEEGTINDPLPSFLVIPTQQGQSFSGTLDFGEAILNGIVDMSGGLTGTYSFQDPVFSGGGTFTGQLSGDQIQLSLAGTISALGKTCTETLVVTATRSATTGPKADLSITAMASPSPVASGARIIYALTVTNAGPDDATNVLITQPTPVGITFASATSSQGQVQSPASGGQGPVIYSLGSLAKGATATVSLTGNVVAAAGATLVDSPFVTSSLLDPSLPNNSITISTPVAAPGTNNNVVAFAAFPTRKAPKPKNNPCSSFTVQNFGLTPMILTLDSIVRTGSDADSGRITDPNDTRFFSISLTNSDQSLTSLDIGSVLTLQSGHFQSFCAKFAALIPALAGKTTGLAASSVLPDSLTSKIVFRQTGGANVSIPIQSRVSTALVLVNLVNPRSQPEVIFTRSGNDITVSYAVFDSNLDVSRAKYEFLDSNGQVVAGPFEIDLIAPLQSVNLVKGQSFSVEQRFTGASSNPQVTGVRLTVFDGETNVSASSSGSELSISGSGMELMNRTGRVTTLYLPDVSLSPRVP